MTHQFQQGDTLIFGSQPLGYDGLGSQDKSTEADLVIEDLQEKYGTQLERLERLPKLGFRAALVTYLYQVEVWEASGQGIPEDLMDEAIEHACPDLWTDALDLCYELQEVATLAPDRIEALIEAITAQLRYDRVFHNKEAA